MGKDCQFSGSLSLTVVALLGIYCMWCCLSCVIPATVSGGGRDAGRRGLNYCNEFCDVLVGFF